MPQLVDCYFLLNSRSKTLYDRFLNKFLPIREETSDEYIVDDNSQVFTSANDLMNYLDQNKNEVQTIYWSNLDKKSSIKFAMVFYTDDGKAIIGMSLIGDSPMEKSIIEVFSIVRAYLDSKHCCITVEEMAPTNSIEFITFCENRYVPSTNNIP